MPFYQEPLDLRLRLGDVVTGLVAHTPYLSSSSQAERAFDYRVDVDRLHRSVVLVPCCSIGDKAILVAPLRHIFTKFLNNPYFEPDITRINREMRGVDSVSTSDLQNLKPQRRDSLLAANKLYALLEHFIYAPHELLEHYTLKSRDVGHYMIDFRDTRKVKCESVISNEEEPTALFPGKLLQLSIETRRELRLKMVEYFGRIPDEDKEVTQKARVDELQPPIWEESPLSIGAVLQWPDEDSAL